MRITRPRYFQHPKIFPRARRIHQRRLQWQSGRRRQEERQSGKIHLPVQGSILRTFCAHRALRCTHRELPLHYLVPRPNKFTTGVAIAVGLVNLVRAPTASILRFSTRYGRERAHIAVNVLILDCSCVSIALVLRYDRIMGTVAALWAP